MATIKASSLFRSFSPQRIKKLTSRQHITQKFGIQSSNLSVPSLQVNNLLDEFGRQKKTTTMRQEIKNTNVVKEMYAIFEAVADRVVMHINIGEQRNNWNQLLLNSINGMISTAATMAALGAINGAGKPFLALRVSATLLYVFSTGILIIMNKIQPSQLAEEQRNASRLFKQLHEELRTKIALKMVDSNDVKNAMEKVLALDKAYPLPLLGVMLEKFPKTVEPAMWWPKHVQLSGFGREKSILLNKKEITSSENGWNENLEDEMKKIVGYIKRKDEEDYLRLAKVALKVNKILAICGPLLTGLAAIGSALMNPFLGVACGALAMVVNTIEHGGQVGMVFEMYRNSAGFFRFMEENIESTLNEDEVDTRENGEVFEAKVALELGRTPSELREFVDASSSSTNPDLNPEFASKLF